MHQHVKKMCSNAQSHPEYLQNIKAVGGGALYNKRPPYFTQLTDLTSKMSNVTLVSNKRGAACASVNTLCDGAGYLHIKYK